MNDHYSTLLNEEPVYKYITVVFRIKIDQFKPKKEKLVELLNAHKWNALISFEIITFKGSRIEIKTVIEVMAKRNFDKINRQLSWTLFCTAFKHFDQPMISSIRILSLDESFKLENNATGN